MSPGSHFGAFFHDFDSFFVRFWMLFSVFEDLGACNSMNFILCDHRELSHDRTSHRCFDLLRLSELGQKWVLMNMDVPVLYESLMPKCSNSLSCFVELSILMIHAV